MLTKKQLCLVQIEKFRHFNGRLPTDGDVGTSGSLGIAMEYLGMLQGDMTKNYIRSRAGIVFHYSDETDHGVISACLTFRELLDLLPE